MIRYGGSKPPPYVKFTGYDKVRALFYHGKNKNRAKKKEPVRVLSRKTVKNRPADALKTRL